MKEIKVAGNAESGAPVILVQAFIKIDTLSKCLDSLRACMGAKDFRLVIFQDGLDGNPHMSEYGKEHQETKDFIERWVETHEAAFQRIEFHPQAQGRGPTRACKLSVDYAIFGAPFVLFTEDDVIFEKDSLTYAQQIIATPDWTEPDVWAAALESVFFDSCHGNVLPSDIKECRQMARDQDLISKYINRKELPPSCFVVTADKWAEWSESHGKAGPAIALLQRRLQAEGKTVLWPIVARARDVGMLHPKGYSMKLREGTVFEQKNTFLTSGDLEADGVVAPVRYEKSTIPLLDRTRLRFQAQLSQGDFPLHIAAFFGQTDSIATLLNAGADPNARVENGRAPLHNAAQKGRTEAIAALLAAGADPNARDKWDRTPLHNAAHLGQTEAIAALLDAGANPNARNENGGTPLHGAAWNGRTEAIAALLDAGADHNARDERGRTPLHSAAHLGQTEAIAALLAAGADHNARNENGRAPLHSAAHLGQTEAIAALLDAGADPNAQGNGGQIPFDLIPEDSPVVGTSAYRRLRDARID